MPHEEINERGHAALNEWNIPPCREGWSPSPELGRGQIELAERLIFQRMRDNGIPRIEVRTVLGAAYFELGDEPDEPPRAQYGLPARIRWNLTKAMALIAANNYINYVLREREREIDQEEATRRLFHAAFKP